MKLLPGHYYHVIYDDPVHPVVLLSKNVYPSDQTSIVLEQVILVESERMTDLFNSSKLEIQNGCYYQVYVVADNYSNVNCEHLSSLGKCRVISEVFTKDFPLFVSFHVSPRFEKILKGEIPESISTETEVNYHGHKARGLYLTQ